MKTYFKKHPLVGYTFIILIIFSLNFFWRWRNGDAMSDVIMLSTVSSVLIGGGVIAGSYWRRKYEQKCQSAKEKVDELMNK